MELGNLTTESHNPASSHLDQMSSREIVVLMNDEDAKIATAVGSVADSIAKAIDVIANRLSQQGRLIYVGAGTSGRLGVLDASECPPTFNSPPEMVIGLIAGGRAALTSSIEGVEDQPDAGRSELSKIGLTDLDVLVGIATSGRTPFVIGALEYGREIGAFTIGVTCNHDSKISETADLAITPIVGPEVISGSTRLKAGTATKMVLNMLTTGAMVRLGKTYGNLMVDLNAKNQKLTDRSKRIIVSLTGLNEADAVAQLARCSGEVKTAVVAQRLAITPSEARQLLARSQGHLRQALEASDVQSFEKDVNR